MTVEEEREYSEDKIHRIYWHGHFLRNYDDYEKCMTAMKWFESFLQSITYKKGE